ncbi:HD domain-containing protein [Desulforegula conservatrix]|uniref:HD domain-containing protein n=1 Tax=Desulforegula conservatrix TaxID=153026 RepID=UPI000417F683|nr:HD domain-containing protein [Desulforegula conservatrix]
MKLYKVGGSIRDRFLNRAIHDTDYVVIGTDEKCFLAGFPSARPVGKKKAVYILDGNEYTLSHSKNIEEDLGSRDLTINALAEDDEGRIFSHPQSFEDIKNKILRPVNQKNFFDDPLRVFRAARFAAEFPDFYISDELTGIMKKTSEKGILSSITAERVGMEVLKAFAAPVPSRFLKLLFSTDSLNPWLEEIVNFPQIPAGPKPYHNGSLLEHTYNVMDRLAGDKLLVWMGFCHDLGKSLTDEKILPHHYGHEKTGVQLAERIGQRLRLPKAFIKAGKTASLWHMKAGTYGDLRPGTRVDMLTSLLKDELFEEVFKLSAADKQNDYFVIAKKDMETILKVKLPEEFRDLGEKSASKIRELRCQAISGSKGT